MSVSGSDISSVSSQSKPERFPRLAAARRWYVKRRFALRIVMQVLGALSSIEAIMSTRTSQGAIAWTISLNTCPYLAVPAYWVFGRSRFENYETMRHHEMNAQSDVERETLKTLEAEGMLFEPQTEQEHHRQLILERLAQMPITRFNDADLLIDGQATFDTIISRIATAKEYVLVQFYIMRSDDLGNRLKNALIAKAKEGVRVYMLYDGLGSRGLSEEYLEELHDAGVKTAGFFTTRGYGNRTRINFRNHRKIVVVDGVEAFVGGHNVGDEYVGKHPVLTPWRDTHIAVRGPVVLEVQVSFSEDWRWATEETLQLSWAPRKAPQGDMAALCLPTGPADHFETATLLMLDLINNAQKRIWIASPYFVPDMQFISALQLAALRGVDVRILIPENNDDHLADLTSYSYLPDTEKAGIAMYRYKPGFMHQKVFLIDEDLAAIGTANFDNRSMRLNFEVMILLRDEVFAQQVETMLETDFGNSRISPAKDYTDGSGIFRFFVRSARLLAPIE